MNQAPSEREIAGIREQLEMLVTEYQKRAAMEGKKLLIVAGELHNGLDSLLTESILLDVAHKHSINNLVVEADPKGTHAKNSFKMSPPFVQNLIMSACAGKEIYGMDLKFMDMPGIQKMIESLTKKSGDSLSLKYTESIYDPEFMRAREKAFSDTILKQNGSTIVITGGSHMPAIIGLEAVKEKFVVLALDVDNTSSYISETRFKAQRINELLKNPDIHRIEFSGNANEMRLWDILAAGMGQEKALRLKKALEEKKIVDSPEILRTQLNKLNALIVKQPGNPTFIAVRSVIHAELGLYRESYQDILAAVRGNRIHNEQLYYMKLSLPPSILREVEAGLDAKFNTAADPSMHYALDFEMLRHLGVVPDNAREKNPGLYAEILKGGISELIPARASYRQIKEIYARNPAALEALHHQNFSEAIVNNLISLKQVGQLSPEQLDGLKSKPYGMDLRREIEKILGPKDSPPLPKPAQPVIIQSPAPASASPS